MPTPQKYDPGTVLSITNRRDYTNHVVVLSHKCGCCYQLLDLHQKGFDNRPRSRTIHEWDVEYVEKDCRVQVFKQDAEGSVSHIFNPS